MTSLVRAKLDQHLLDLGPDAHISGRNGVLYRLQNPAPAAPETTSVPCPLSEDPDHPVFQNHKDVTPCMLCPYFVDITDSGKNWEGVLCTFGLGS